MADDSDFRLIVSFFSRRDECLLHMITWGHDDFVRNIGLKGAESVDFETSDPLMLSVILENMWFTPSKWQLDRTVKIKIRRSDALGPTLQEPKELDCGHCVDIF